MNHHHPQTEWTAAPAAIGLPELAIMARSMIAARRALHGPLPSELIHDPALDLLLQLFVAEADGRITLLKELIVGTSTSKSVTARWVAALKDYGYLNISDEIVLLTSGGHERVEAAIRAVANSQWHIGTV